MAVGLSAPADLLPVDGVRVGVGGAGIKTPGRRDVAVIELAPGSRCAGVFTRNRFCAGPVIVARRHLAQTDPRYLIVNSGNANAGTGSAGVDDAEASCRWLAEWSGCGPAAVLPYSTGVIGERLPLELLRAGLAQAYADLRPDGWVDAAAAIMTTDTVPKGGSRRLVVAQHDVVLTGIAKGAGMIRPNMATMLAFMATDASVEPAFLHHCLARAAARSFNRITVDGDTSTNDAVALAATGRSGAAQITGDGPYAERFEAAVTELCVTLAQAIVRDGEGATRFITVRVTEGVDEPECLAVARAVAESPLVKTAFYAGDPNWGRILAAVGRAGIDDLEVDAVRIHLDELPIVRAAGRDPDYREAAARSVMQREEITVHVALGRGAASTCVWTCDLSHQYVTINAEYRT